MSYGITPTGFVPKDLSTIIAELTNRAIELFGVDMDLRQTNPLIIYINEISPDFQQLWNILADMYANFFIISASGTALDQLAVDRGLLRLSPVKATGDITVTAPTGTTIPGGTVVSTSGDSLVYFETTGQKGIGELTESFTSVSGPPYEVTLTQQAEGSFGTDQIIVQVFPDTLTEVASSPGTGEFSSDYADPTVITVGDDPSSATTTVTYFDKAATSDIIDIQARTAGSESNLGSSQVNTLVTPIAGVTNVINEAATSGGDDEETDALFRIRLIAVPVANWTEADLEALVETISGVKSADADDGEKVETFTTSDESGGGPFTVDLAFETLDIFRVTQYNDSAGTRTELGEVADPPSDETEFSLIAGSPDKIKYTESLASDDTLTVTYMDQDVGVGVFRLKIVPNTPPLSSTLRDGIDSTVKSNKPFGVSFFVDEPTFSTIGMTITIVIDTGYTLSAVSPSISSGITAYMGGIKIAESLLHNRIIEIVMSVTGITDVTTVQYFVQNEVITRGAGSTDTPIHTTLTLPSTITDENSVVYDITTDYILTSGDVDWSPGGSEPAQDVDYTVSTYNTTADVTIVAQTDVIYVEGTVTPQE